MQKLKTTFLVVGLCLGLIISRIFYYATNQTFGVIDPSQIIKFVAEDLALSSAGKATAQDVQIAAQQLRQKIEAFSKKKRIILLNKDLVWSALPDLTSTILTYLQNEKK